MKIKKYAERIPQYTARAMMPLVKLPKPPVLAGVRMVRRFAEVIATTDVKRLLIVCGPEESEKPFVSQLIADLDEQEIASVVYDMSEAKTILHDVYSAVDLYLSKLCGGVLGVGSGAAIDCAKLAAARITNIKPVPKMAGVGRVLHRLPPFFAVPTAFGSGSEASIAAEAEDEETGQRFTVIDPKLCPLAVCLDPELTADLPRKTCGALGMEALSRAIEAYIGLFDTDDVRTAALDASRMLFENLEASAADPDDHSLRLSVQRASALAGEAFGRGMAGYAWAIADVLAEAYGLDEAAVCAAVLPSVLEFSKDVCGGKLAELAYNAGMGSEWDDDMELADALIARLRAMHTHFGLPKTFEAIRPGEVRTLAARVASRKRAAFPVAKLMAPDDAEAIIAALIP